MKKIHNFHTSCCLFVQPEGYKFLSFLFFGHDLAEGLSFLFNNYSVGLKVTHSVDLELVSFLWGSCYKKWNSAGVWCKSCPISISWNGTLFGLIVIIIINWLYNLFLSLVAHGQSQEVLLHQLNQNPGLLTCWSLSPEFKMINE